jgi:hypothetical protein
MAEHLSTSRLRGTYWGAVFLLACGSMFPRAETDILLAGRPAEEGELH